MSLVDELIAPYLPRLKFASYQETEEILRALVSAALEVPRVETVEMTLAAPAIPKGDALTKLAEAAMRHGSIRRHISSGAEAAGAEREFNEKRDAWRKDALKRMVDRFLAWPLPKDFAPDCGISFDGRGKDARGYEKSWPIGTNLFTADQAKAMLAHVLDPEAAGDAVPVALTDEQCARITFGVLGNREPGTRADLYITFDDAWALIRGGYAAAPAKGDTPSVVRDALRLEIEKACLLGNIFERDILNWKDAIIAALAPAGEPNGQKT